MAAVRRVQLTSRRPRAWVVVAGVVAVLAVAAAGTLFKLFVFPTATPVQRPQAVVVLGGLDGTSRLQRGIEVVQDNPGSVLMLSLPGVGQQCPAFLDTAVAQHVCFVPDPASTQGEAQAATAYARQQGWSTIDVVVTADQVLRAQDRFDRCWEGSLGIVEAPTDRQAVVKMIPYQLAAVLKSLVVTPGC